MMSKITLSAILTIIRVVLTLGEKIVRSVYTIIDICDDGIINQSAPKPVWYDDLVRVVRNLELAMQDLGKVADEVPDSYQSNAQSATSSQ